MQHNFCGGKYTVIFDERTGNLHALRNGEEWSRDLVGDKLVLSMLQRVDAQNALLLRAKALLEEVEGYVDTDTAPTLAKTFLQDSARLCVDIDEHMEEQTGG